MPNDGGVELWEPPIDGETPCDKCGAEWTTPEGEDYKVLVHLPTCLVYVNKP